MVSLISDGESDKWRYDSFSTNVSIVSKRMCVQMRKKGVAFETSCVCVCVCVYIMVYVFLRRRKTTAYQNSARV
jgi:hypothetical protein